MTISTAATAEVTCTNGVCSPTGKQAVLNVSQLEALLAAGNVTLKAAPAGFNVKLEISAAITWASSGNLYTTGLDPIDLNNTIAMDGSGGLSLDTQVSYGPKGNITSLSTANSLSIANISYTLVDSIESLAAAIASNPSGDFALAGPYDAQADGVYGSAPVATAFAGQFDGLGNAISHMTIKDTQGGSAALFSQLGPKATVQNLFLLKAQIAGSGSTPLFVGTLAGVNYGNIFHCFVSGRELGSGSGGIFEGGLVGESEGTIVNSGAAVDVKATQSSMSGGLVGLALGGVMDAGSIEYSFATGAVTGNGGQSFLGGLVGDSYEMAQNTVFEGITQSYATGAVTGRATDSIGGLIGFAQDSFISSVYATGPISGGTSHTNYGFAGGVVGFDAGSNSYTSSYWDTTTMSGISASEGAGNYPNMPGTAGLTTAQLQSGVPYGFSKFEWNERARTNNGLPYLLNGLPQ